MLSRAFVWLAVLRRCDRLLPAQMALESYVCGVELGILECRDLRNGVGFHIAEGETYGLLGPNGAGKTPTISMICGLLEPDGGEILVDGVSLTPKSVDVKAKIGFLPQDLAIYPDLTAKPESTDGQGWMA